MNSIPDEWYAEVSVSPEWFAVQDSALASPAGEPPHTVPLTEDYALIGRESASRDVHPVIQAGEDSGTSRRHADLTYTESDGWMLRDLGSVNGTYVQRQGEPLPTQRIEQPTPVGEGDAIYVGAWTRIVLRRAN